MGNVWAHDVMERMRLRRKVEARHMGLGDIDVGTFPSHPGNVVVTDGGGFWKGLALASFLSLGAGGVFAVNGLNAVDHKKTPAPSEHLFEIEILGDETGVMVNSVKEINE